MKITSPWDLYSFSVGDNQTCFSRKAMPFLDKVLDELDISCEQELEDIYKLWSWHPGMG